MKRSEMIKKLQVVYYDTFDEKPFKETCDLLLKCCEDCGMLPPATEEKMDDGSKLVVYVGWEPEEQK